MCRKKLEQIQTESTRGRPALKTQMRGTKWLNVVDEDDPLELFNFRQGDSHPYQVQILINNKKVLMEIDTGAAVTCQSKSAKSYFHIISCRGQSCH